MTIAPGTRLGPYEVVAPIGAGGMGEVYKARDTRLERSVAIKILPVEFAQNAQLTFRFEREAKTISQLNHPNICTLYDVGHENGTHFLVMELLEGESLADRVAKGPLPLHEVLRYGVQIAEALDKAHRQGVVHRDLKPGNVMITRSGAKLLDFGLARVAAPAIVPHATAVATEQKALTQEGTILGTFQYMSPEQLEGVEADARSDIFAFGTLLYEMATGRRAFQGKTRTSLIAAIVSSTPPPLSELQPLTPPALEHVVSKCLEKDPEDRWQNAHDVAAELKWISEAGSQAGVAAPLTVRRRVRERLAWGVAAVLAIATLASGLLFWRQWSAEGRRTPIRTAILPPDKTSFDFLGVSAAPELSPDGRRVVYGVVIDGKRSLWVRPLDSTAAQILSGTEGASFPFWSPDGRYIGFFADGKLKKIEAGGGAAVALCDALDGRGGSWSRNGAIVFAVRYSTIYRVPASGGSPVEVTTFDLNGRITTHRWPRFLPDGRHFLFTGASPGIDSAENAICLGSIDGQKSWKPLLHASTNPLYYDGRILYVRDGVLTAQRFDEKKLAVVGDPVPLTEQQIATDTNFFHSVVSVASNGTVLYQTGPAMRTSELAWFDRGGKRIGVIGDAQAYAAPALSPDGRFAAASIGVAQQANIWVFDLGRDGVRSRATFGSFLDSFPIFSHDGTRLVYSSRKKQNLDLYLHDLATGSEEPLVVSDSDKVAASWSKDGTTIFYTELSRGKTSSDLWYVSLSDRKPHVYLRTSFGEAVPRISPDGKWLAYQSNESGRYEVYLAPFPPTGAKWQVSTSTGGGTRWRADGKELVYSSIDAKPILMSVPVTLGSTPRIDRPVALFETHPNILVQGNWWDMTADAQRFLINSRIGDEAPLAPLTLVQFFDVELRAAEAKLE